MPSTALSAGRLNRRITFEAPIAGTKDATGGAVELWDFHAAAWASAEPLSGRLLEQAQQRAAEADTRFIVRWRTDLDTYHRILWRDVAYEILWLDAIGSNEGLEILARRFDPQPELAQPLLDFDDEPLVDFDDAPFLVFS